MKGAEKVRVIKLFVLTFIAGLMLSSCYTQLAVVQRDKVYQPQEEERYAADQDSVAVDTIFYGGENPGNTFITRNYIYGDYFDDYRFGRNPLVRYDPWYWDNYYFDLSIGGYYGYPGYFPNYYWYVPYVAFYPPYYAYYWDDWNVYPYYGSGNFKQRPFNKNGHIVKHEHHRSRVGTRTTVGDFGSSAFLPTRSIGGSAIVKTGSRARSGKRIRTGNIKVERTGRSTHVRAIRPGKTLHRKVVYVKRRSSARRYYVPRKSTRSGSVRSGSRKAVRKRSSNKGSVYNSSGRSRSVSSSYGNRSYSTPSRSSSFGSSGRSRSASSGRSTRSSGSRGGRSRRR